MAKSLSLSHISLFIFRPKSISSSIKLSLLSSSRFNHLNKIFSISSSISFSTTATPYPLQYDLIISRPDSSKLPPYHRRRSPRPERAKPDNFPESNSSFDGWVDQKLSEKEAIQSGLENSEEMDKSKRKYYNKRRKRMYGSDSEDDRTHEDKFVELKPEVVDFPRLHKREEELYFYDAFAYPWEKEKHYKMVYQLEKKYFPDQCLDKAFVQPGEVKAEGKERNLGKNKAMNEKKEKVVNEVDDNGLVFFEESEEGKKEKKDMGLVKDVSEKKVEEFFKCLKKVPSKNGEVTSVEPYLVTRNTELPPRWDGPNGTVVLVNKPKG